MITGRSCCRIDVTDSQPRPRRLKTVSVMTVVPISWPRSMPKMVTIGVSAARRLCFTTTPRRGRPFARAVRMKSSPLVSSTLARVSRA